jgi:alpha-mannosidase
VPPPRRTFRPADDARVHDDSTLVLLRVARFVRERLSPALYRRRWPANVRAWSAPGEPVPFAEAASQEFAPFAIGTAWGRPWGTVWFHVTGEVPAGWTEPGTRAELVVDLGFTSASPGFQAEGLAYAADGTVLSGIEPQRRQVSLPGGAGSPVELYIEASANPNIGGDWEFRPTPLGDAATAGTEPLYRLGGIDIGQLDVTVWDLVQDFWTLRGLVTELPADLPRRAELVRALERAVEAVDPEDVAGTAGRGRDELVPVLASPAYASAHRIHAVGHAHIDSAWLWPVRETVRKVARTFANVVALQEQDGPELVFAASSAQQYAWLAEHYPALFARVRAQVAAGRFVPVGGMWVESDTNMPGGEALARQFVAGQRFFIDELGVECQEVWLPDSFGYSAALPQIMKAAGCRWFLTQKISWNETNVMPHHTFAWEGIDGTRIFTHFPPVDTYNAELSGAELARAQRRFAEKGRANTSLVPFGWGDGGGGPTREMLAAAARTGSLEGSPTVRITSPAEFFATAEAEYPRPPVWSGELYLEFHRGTYTSQARTKRGNRRSEHLLREAELWATTAAVRTGAEYPADVLQRCWRTVLLQQFHDILPGTSIAWVHQQAEREYARVASELERVIADAIGALVGPGDRELAANAGPYAVDGVVGLGVGAVGPAGAEPAGAGPSGAGPSGAGQTASDVDGGVLLVNAALRVRIDHRGLIVSMHDRAADRELIPPDTPANLLQLFRDTPSRWDAWDLDEHYRRSGRDLLEVDELTVGPGPTVRVVRSSGPSTITQRISLRGDDPVLHIVTEVDWHDRQKLLKLAFPLDVHAERSTSEIQFGHLHRPTHTNTSWDAARFEICAHRWVHVGEPGYGVAVANDATYGHDIGRDTRSGGGTTTTVRLSLLRAPLFPDPEADQGRHRFAVAMRVGASIADAVAEGYRLNLPPRRVRGDRPVPPLLTVDDPAVVVEAVKPAEDGSGDVVARLYEAFGTRAVAGVEADFAHTSVIETDLLERPVPEPVCLRDGTLRMRPFQIVTLRWRR